MTNIKARSCKHRFYGKTISITYSECVSVASITECKAHLPYIVMLATCQAVPYFSTLFRRCCSFRENVVEHKIVF